MPRTDTRAIRHPALHREHRILRAEDVMEILGCSQAKAYRIIKALNKELVQKGILRESIMNGRVPESYFYERVFLEPSKEKAS